MPIPKLDPDSKAHSKIDCCGMGHGQKALEEYVHHTSRAVNVIPKAVLRGDRPQVCTVPDRGGSRLFVPVHRGMAGEGCNRLQPRPPITSVAQPAVFVPKEFSRTFALPGENSIVPPSRKLEANIALPSPVMMGRTGVYSPGCKQMRVSTSSSTKPV